MLLAYEWPLCANTGRPHNDAIDPISDVDRSTEFPSAVEAVLAATKFQNRVNEFTVSDAEGERIAFPIHIDDIIGEPHDIVGDGVTFAARLERIAEPGGTRISSSPSGLRQARRWNLPISASRASRTSPVTFVVIATGREKSSTDRFQEARYRSVTLMNHTQPAIERADANRLPTGGKIGQHGRSPHRLERPGPIINRKRQDAEIRYHGGALRLRTKELTDPVIPCGRRKLSRYPLQHSGHRRGRSRRP
jgi:hypothetical protein